MTAKIMHYLASSTCILLLQCWWICIQPLAPVHSVFLVIKHRHFWNDYLELSLTLEWKEGVTNSPAWYQRHFNFFLSFNDKLTEWVGSNYCLHFLPTNDFFHQPSEIACLKGFGWPLHLYLNSTFSVLSFLMVWHTEHIWLLPVSQHCSSGIKFIFLLLFCFLFWFIFFPL